MIKLNGDYFGNLLSTTAARSRLVAALIADLSRMLKVHSSRIEIQGLVVGSLLVNYSIAQNTSESATEAQSVVTTTTKTLIQSQGRSVMVDTAALYAADAVPTGTIAAPITVASATVTSVNTAAVTLTTAAADNAPSSDNSAECGVSCRLAVGGAAAVAVIGIVAVTAGLIINSKRKVKEGPEESEVSSEAPMPQQECTKLAMEATAKSSFREAFCEAPMPSEASQMESTAELAQLQTDHHDLTLRDFD